MTFVIFDVDGGGPIHAIGNPRGKYSNGSDFLSAMPQRDTARGLRLPQDRGCNPVLSYRSANPVDWPQADGLPPMQFPFYDLIQPVCQASRTTGHRIGPDVQCASAVNQRTPSKTDCTKAWLASKGAAGRIRIRHAAALLAMVAIGTASPALGDNLDKKANAAAIATIKARAEQLRADPRGRKCLGADAVTCLASLSFGLTLTTEPLWMGGGFKLPGPVQRDIHGEAVSATMDFLIRFNPKDRYLFNDSMVGAKISLSDGEHVDSVHFDLKENPLLAVTEADWDATHVFELATAVLGPACIGTDRLAFYRRYDAIQRQESTPDKVEGRYRNRHVWSSTSGSTKICGVTMTAMRIRASSPSMGSYGGATLMFDL
jgi:hypothetical protein